MHTNRAIPLQKADFDKSQDSQSTPIHIHIYSPFVVPEPLVMATEADDYAVTGDGEDVLEINGVHEDTSNGIDLISLDEDNDTENGLYASSSM